jgi:lipoprotein-releasing system permease protein
VPLELEIALRYLRGSRRGSRLLSFISVIAIGGVVVGVGALIVVMGVMNGLQRDMRDKILIGTPDVRVTSVGTNARLDDWQAMLAKVQRTPGVVVAGPYVMTQALASTGPNQVDGGIVVGLPPASPGSPRVTDIERYVVSGRFRFAGSDSGGLGIVLGKLLAARLGADTGGTITITGFGTREVNAATGQLSPTIMQFEVTGIFETGLYDYDNSFMYMSLANAQELAGLGSGVTGIEVKTRDRADATTIGARLAPVIAPYTTIDWQQQNRSLFQALQLEKLGMGFILLLIVLVAAFNIVSNLTMVVADKTREIGILKAMGMTSRSVHRVFFAQGIVIGATGTALGVILGIAVSLALGKYQFIKLDPEAYFIDHLPIATDAVDVVITIVASLAIAALATAYPSRQAARLYPIEAIRHD